MNSVALAVVRLAIAAVCIAHGSLALFGWWANAGTGPGGLAQTAAVLAAGGLQPATFLAALASIVQVVTGVLLALGWFTRIAAVVELVDVGIGLWALHLKWGFFLNYTHAPGRGDGIEYTLVLASVLVCLALTGGGTISIDGRRATRAATRAAGRARLRGKV